MNSPMTDERIAEIKAREQAATKGPWLCVFRGDGSGSVYEGTEEEYDDVALIDDARCPYIRGEVIYEDGVFAAHARQDIPDLLAEVERLRAIEAEHEEQSITVPTAGGGQHGIN